MRHLKVLGVSLVAMFALGITATSAFAVLPDLSIALEGSKYPVHLQFKDNGTTIATLNTTGGSKTEAKGVLLLLLSENKLGSGGTFEALFLNVKQGTFACEQTGEKNKEEVLTKGTYALVYPSLSPLTLGLAFKVEPVAFTCNSKKVSVKVEGCALSKVTDPKTGTEDVELATGELKGDGKGKNLLTEYDNAEGTGKVSCQLKANFGTGFLQAEENIGEAVHLEVLEKNMFTISPI